MCVHVFDAGRSTGALHMHHLIIMTMSGSVGEIFTTLVWHSASSVDEQLPASQIISQLYCVFLFFYICGVSKQGTRSVGSDSFVWTKILDSTSEDLMLGLG